MSTRHATRDVCWTDLGRIPYDRAWALQRALVAERKEGLGEDRLIFVEHPPVITLGRRAVASHILADETFLAARDIPVYAIERGGDVTYHGPGQLVAYPILDLRLHRKDVRWYANALLETLVRTLGAFGVHAWAREGRETGVWVDGDRGPAKIAALGVRIERWVTYHGVALNVDPCLADFDLIVPCGLAGVRTTSMARLLGRSVDLVEAREAFVRSFGEVFDVSLAEADCEVPA